jgi:hypothetical protein
MPVALAAGCGVPRNQANFQASTTSTEGDPGFSNDEATRGCIISSNTIEFPDPVLSLPNALSSDNARSLHSGDIQKGAI